MTINLDPEMLKIYRANAKKRLLATYPQREKRRQKGLKLAHEAANLLRDKFNVTKVKIFGSVLISDCFTMWSDVDIAAWGIPDDKTFLAMEMVRDLDQEIEVNLVDVNWCKSEILKAIEEKGIEI